eukprot:TRINITY_DN14216_c0_g1_i8.p1 TRINITY_DN14216_c0_g1~~TRINITY_DN14216_c0_g1_i8.p1  ORF type:complete len:334 (-),score=58.26 TRINITY_DN14216_c0_g1_i8:201-1202(-)
MSRIVGAKASEVAIMGTLTNNIHTMLAPFYRPTPLRHKILIEKGAFPSDWYLASSQIILKGFSPSSSLVQVEPREGEYVLRKQDILNKITEMADHLALVFLPGVQYFTGQVLPMREITCLCHSLGIKVGFDLAHAVGNVVLQLHEWEVDFACWCSYKYLNSGPGGIGGIFVHERYDDESLPRMAGWWGHDHSTRFAMDRPFTPIPGALGFRQSNPSVLTVMSLSASLQIFDEIGMENLRAKSENLTELLEILVKRKLGGSVTIITPSNAEERGCQLSLLFMGSSDVHELEMSLSDLGIVCDVRGKIIRVAPTPLYNSFSDVFNFVKALGTVLK